MRTPVTMGSKVPEWPVFSTRRIRLIQATTSWELGREGLSRHITTELKLDYIPKCIPDVIFQWSSKGRATAKVSNELDRRPWDWSVMASTNEKFIVILTLEIFEKTHFQKQGPCRCIRSGSIGLWFYLVVYRQSSHPTDYLCSPAWRPMLLWRSFDGSIVEERRK